MAGTKMSIFETKVRTFKLSTPPRKKGLVRNLLVALPVWAGHPYSRHLPGDVASCSHLSQGLGNTQQVTGAPKVLLFSFSVLASLLRTTSHS
jgi:hypothetical protein